MTRIYQKSLNSQLTGEERRKSLQIVKEKEKGDGDFLQFMACKTNGYLMFILDISR
jgi:hypothetical protein